MVGLERLRHGGGRVCPNVDCGRSFDRPLKLTVLCSDPVETYFACPFCMSRVDLEEPKPRLPKLEKPVLPVEEDVEDVKEDVKPLKRVEGVPEVSVDKQDVCLHEFGYLKSRPKGKPIPDECLTCPKMIQCLM
ncbi:MAG: hypothetical protein ACQXXH_00780 [Candidatus Bathyarchaeia archaeon]|nr:hypothetical protein [Candidatus Bathyarchaeota archaeon A05DMB-4]MDH7595399.1 hypothetical protein [Candidatus Bathyarchaeota archaeon]